MNKLIPLIIFLSFSFLAFGQSDFREGFIVKNNNDTIYGLLDYKGNKANVKRCIFKTNKDSETVEFSPIDLKAYRFLNSKFYISKPVTIREKDEILFLEYLINGIVDIFYFHDMYGDHYFIEYKEDELYELKNELEIIKANNRRYFKDSKEYIGLLNQMLNETPLLSEKIEQTKLTHESLIELSHDYHNQVCEGEECIIYEKEPRKHTQNFGIIIGMNSLSIVESGEILKKKYLHLKDADYNFSFYPSIGLFYKTNFPYKYERINVQNELTFSKVTQEATSTHPTYLYTKYYSADIKWTQNELDNSLLVRYSFPANTIHPIVHFGGFFSYSLTREYEQIIETIDYDTGEVIDTLNEKEDLFLKTNFGVICGIGLSSKINNKEIIFDVKYKRGFGVLRYINTNTFTFNLGYQIGK